MSFEITVPENIVPPEMIANLGERQLTQLAKNLADAARAKWIKLGQEDGSSRRHDYIRGIQKPIVSRGTAVISLVGTVANLLEHGDSGEDMRQTLLGDKVPVVARGERGKHEAAEGGFYRAVPLRHSVPGATGGVVGQEMGSAYSDHDAVADSKKLGAEVYGQAMKLGRGERLGEGMAPKLRDHHKTDIYAGMIREEKTYEEDTQAQYMTFRTISTHITEVEEGPGGTKIHKRIRATVGWQRGPIRARRYAEKVSEFVAKIAPKAAQALLGSKGRL
jgi:hypothetical protein